MRLIDADAMNEELFYKQLGGKDTLITAECAFNMINEQPTVEAKPVVHGEWLKVNGCLSWFYRCSVCGDFNEYKTNFCKHCGANMRGGKNEMR